MKNIFNLIARFLVIVGCGIMVFTRSGIERIGWLLLFLGFGYCFVHKALKTFMRTMENYNRKLHSGQLNEQQDTQQANQEADSDIPPVGNMMNNMFGGNYMMGDTIEHADVKQEANVEEKSDEC